MNWLRSSFAKFQSATFEREIYSFPLIKGYLKRLHIILLTILISLVCSFHIFIYPFFEIGGFLYNILLTSLYLLMFIAFIFLWICYSQTDFFVRFSPLMFWSASNLIYFFNFSVLPSLIDPQELYFLFNDEILQNFGENPSSAQVNLIFRQMTSFLDNWFNLIFVLFFCFLNRNYCKEILRRFRASPATFISYVILLILIYNYLFGEINFLFQPSLPDVSEKEQPINQENLTSLYKSGSDFFRGFFYFSTILIIPFWEEIIYRYLPTEIFGDKKWTIPLFFFATFWFALQHINYEDLNLTRDEPFNFGSFIKNLFQDKLLPYWFMSFVFMGVYWISDFSLIYPITLHLFANITSFSVLTILNF